MNKDLQAALALHQAGQLDKAAGLYRRILERDPDDVYALHYLGVAAASTGDFEQAKSLMARSFELQPANIPFTENYATILVQSGDHKSALQVCGRGLQTAATSIALLYVSAVALFKLKRFDESLAQFDKLLSLQPNHIAATNERGSVLAEMAKYEAALSSFQRALALQPGYADAHLNSGNLYARLHRYDAAFAAYDRALAINPALADAWLGRGNLLVQHKRYSDALGAFDRALALKPRSAPAWLGRGNALFALRQYAEAFAAYDRACAIESDCPYAEGRRLEAKMQACEWRNFAGECADLIAAVKKGVPTSPFGFLSVPAPAADQLKCAARYIADLPQFAPLYRGEAYRHERIRVAYVSADFHEHPIGRLLAGLFERHDRSHFEVTGISIGPPSNSPLRARIAGAFEHFVDAAQNSDQKIAELIRHREIDVAVDLMGFTLGNRLAVFTRRPAPIQVNYLGYIGTMGAEFIDYVIADKIALPFDQQPFFSEKIVHLPDCFLVTDDRQEMALRMPSREEAGLPPEGFVFGSFNNSYKLTRPVFERWMRLLRAVEGSVLWLAEASPAMAANLRREAERCAIDPRRLIFAPHVPLAEHLARHRLAGLFLDTIPYNAGATAAAALWSGVPLVTVMGETFVGRMAASMLHAIGLPELAAPDLDAYEGLALKLAQDPPLLAGIRHKLHDNLRSTPLFDTDRFRRHIEQAYLAMIDRHQRGERPSGFSVEPQ